MQKKEMEQLQSRCQEISMINNRVRINTEKVAIDKWIKAKEQKDEAIRKEIAIINKKDGEARRLEQTESAILKRLRETHFRQQQAIQEIQEIFANGSIQSKLLLHESSRKSIEKLCDGAITPDLAFQRDSNSIHVNNNSFIIKHSNNKGDKGRDSIPEVAPESKNIR